MTIYSQSGYCILLDFRHNKITSQLFLGWMGLSPDEGWQLTDGERMVGGCGQLGEPVLKPNRALRVQIRLDRSAPVGCWGECPGEEACRR